MRKQKKDEHFKSIWIQDKKVARKRNKMTIEEEKLSIEAERFTTDKIKVETEAKQVNLAMFTDVSRIMFANTTFTDSDSDSKTKLWYEEARGNIFPRPD